MSLAPTVCEVNSGGKCKIEDIYNNYMDCFQYSGEMTYTHFRA